MKYFVKIYNPSNVSPADWTWELRNDEGGAIALAPHPFENEGECDAGIAAVREAFAQIEIQRDPSAPESAPPDPGRHGAGGPDVRDPIVREPA